MKRSNSRETNEYKRSKLSEDVLVQGKKQELAIEELMELLSQEPKDGESSSSANVTNQHPPSASFHTWFSKIANCLCNKLSLVVADSVHFRIVEVEMYLKFDGHNDSFTHGDDQQLHTCGQWYFHRQNGKSYKGGTYKGLDITFGTPGKVYGGILLRSIENMESGEVVEGPCRVVDTILAAANKKSITSLVDSNDSSENNLFSLIVDNSSSTLKLVSLITEEVVADRVVVCSPRVGLTLKRCDEFKPYFLMQPYRFHSRPDKVTKYKSTSVLAHWRSSGASMVEIAKLFDTPQSQIGKLFDAFEAARSRKKQVIDFIGLDLKADSLIQLCAATM